MNKGTEPAQNLSMFNFKYCGTYNELKKIRPVVLGQIPWGVNI